MGEGCVEPTRNCPLPPECLDGLDIEQTVGQRCIRLNPSRGDCAACLHDCPRACRKDDRISEGADAEYGQESKVKHTGND